MRSWRARRRLAAGRGAGGSRSAVQALSRRPRQHQVAARRSGAFLRQYADGIEASPARLQAGRGAPRLLERLKRKYGPTLADVVARRDALRREVVDLTSGDQRIAELEALVRAARATYLAAADALSDQRRRIAETLCTRLEALLGELAMARNALRGAVRRSALPESSWSIGGNRSSRSSSSRRIPGEDLRPLARIVSGGELSRIMLAIKTLTATTRHGFSDAADRPPSTSAPGLDLRRGGRRHRRAGGRRRRAQAAGARVSLPGALHHAPAADRRLRRHALPDREAGRRRPHTHDRVARLDEHGRVEELARMLGGEAISDGLRRSAREMLDGAASRTGERKAKSKGERRKRKSSGESERRKAKARDGDGTGNI